MQFKEIPRKLIVAKRLAQCLNPALPNGVHQRALDVYSHVLAVIGVGASYKPGLGTSLTLLGSLLDCGETLPYGPRDCFHSLNTLLPPSRLVKLYVELSRNGDPLTLLQPTLLNLYDTYYVSLQHGLRPVMKAFVLALLPGLEEETGEFFEKVLKNLFPFSISCLGILHRS